jgi:hypothetical protein
MQITLLPPLLPSERVVPVPGTAQPFTPGSRILASVLQTGLEGGTLLALGGREWPAGSKLPYPPGTVLRLEVVAGGAQPQLRVVAVDSSGVAPAGDPQMAPPSGPVGPPVSPISYGLAAAVLAAREGLDVRSAAGAVVRWLPALVASGLITASQADALLKALSPVPVRVADGAVATETVARAIADRVAHGGLLLERRLADVLGQRQPDAANVAAADVRSRLAVLAHLLQQAPADVEDAGQAVVTLQDAMLAEQARAAAHLARDGVMDIRIPLQIQGVAAEMRLRMQIRRDAEPRSGGCAMTPWRQVRLDLALEGLGPIQVRLAVLSTHVRAEFFVEHPATADRIEAGLATLGGAVERAGFVAVLSRVVVDPVRVCAPDDLPDLPPQHTIVDVRT